jgi:GT2 family glycosyltransferase
MPAIGVILCTHNPRADNLERTLAALQQQTLPCADWELLLVDNASQRRVAEQVSLTWHPHARHVREEQLGLTPARLRGMAEASAPLLVFVDDDNLLAPDYLAQAVAIAADWPRLGAWGGRVLPEYETAPAPELRELVKLLALTDFTRDEWSNARTTANHAIPCGAGLCVRREVALAYRQQLAGHPERAALDRRGALLTSCGDIDLALTACDLGLGTGRFVQLQLTHLIPTHRVQRAYLLKLRESVVLSALTLNTLRGAPAPRRSRLESVFKRLKLLRARGLARDLLRADLTAYERAVELLGKTRPGTTRQAN